MTVPTTASEDLLDSTQDGPQRASRRWVMIVVTLALVAAAAVGFQALQPDPVPTPESAQETTASTDGERVVDRVLVDASAARLYGDLEPGGGQNFFTAASAAEDVVQIHCRPDIPSWAAALITSGNSYDTAVFIMSPANRRYGTFVVQVELTWAGDHYSYAVVAGHVERCAV